MRALLDSVAFLTGVEIYDALIVTAWFALEVVLLIRDIRRDKRSD